MENDHKLADDLGDDANTLGIIPLVEALLV